MILAVKYVPAMYATDKPFMPMFIRTYLWQT